VPDLVQAGPLAHDLSDSARRGLSNVPSYPYDGISILRRDRYVEVAACLVDILLERVAANVNATVAPYRILLGDTFSIITLAMRRGWSCSITASDVLDMNGSFRGVNLPFSWSIVVANSYTIVGPAILYADH
jgi:hypothetical protein